MRREKQKAIDARLSIRIAREELLRIKKLARERGMTVTALIKARLKNIPLVDYIHEKTLFLYVEKLTKEMNHIGVNINQAVHALHQINQGKREVSNEVKNFNHLFQHYNSKRDELCSQLEKLLFK